MAKKKGPLNSRSINTDGSSITPMALELANAVNEYRRRHDRPFPTWSEVLAIIESLGYRKVATPRELPAPSSKTRKRPHTPS